jgi:hypothetical protein
MIGDARSAGCFSTGSGLGLPLSDRIPSDLRDRVEPADCDRPHTFEVYHRGSFTGADADMDSSRAASDSVRVLETCDRAARSFLGGDYAEARVRLDLIVPNERGWRAGDRWYACVMAETTGSEDRIVERTGSLRDGLRGDRPMRIGCVDVTAVAGVVKSVDYIRCEYLHAGEFIGAPTVPGGSDTAARDACVQLAASYLEVAPAQLPARTDLTIFWTRPPEQEPTTGTIQCYLAEKAYQSVIRGTVKGLGAHPLPSGASARAS